MHNEALLGPALAVVIVCAFSGDVAAFVPYSLCVMIAGKREDGEGWTVIIPISLLFPLFRSPPTTAILRKANREKNVLPYGKYIEYKSCQINKINVVPITIIFDDDDERYCDLSMERQRSPCRSLGEVIGH